MPTLVSRRLRLWLGPLFLALPLTLAACIGQTGAPSAAPTAPANPAVVATPLQDTPTSGAATSPTPASVVAAATPVAASSPGAPAPVCRPGGPATVAQTEGPYYKANPPQRASLIEPGIEGERLALYGYVLDRQCNPVAGARVDFWQADAQGRYDNSGYRMRGYQLTDAQGRYRLATVVPGLYPGRTRHLHVKVQPPGGQTLTTQLYFPDEPGNATDRIFDQALVMQFQATPDGKSGTFTFIVGG